MTDDVAEQMAMADASEVAEYANECPRITVAFSGVTQARLQAS